MRLVRVRELPKHIMYPRPYIKAPDPHGYRGPALTDKIKPPRSIIQMKIRFRIPHTFFYKKCCINFVIFGFESGES